MRVAVRVDGSRRRFNEGVTEVSYDITIPITYYTSPGRKLSAAIQKLERLVSRMIEDRSVDVKPIKVRAKKGSKK